MKRGREKERDERLNMTEIRLISVLNIFLSLRGVETRPRRILSKICLKFGLFFMQTRDKPTDRQTNQQTVIIDQRKVTFQ